jgi:hypothetical protein
MQREGKGAHGATARRLANWAREAEREEGHAGEETDADSLAPLGSEREREGTRERELPLTGGSHLSGSAGTRPGWAELGRLGRWAAVTPGFRRQTECEPCTCQDQQFMYTTDT